MDLKHELRSFIVETLLFGDGSVDLADDTSFLREGIVDSTGVVELVMFVEERFGLIVDDAEVVPENFDSINGLAGYVERKLQ